jgi:hypothetical protein
MAVTAVRVSVLRGYANLFGSNIIQLNFLNLFSLALFGKMVTPSCIHLRLLKLNFLSGVFTDNIACNLYMAISSYHVA